MYKFEKPYDFEGTLYTEINLNLESLKGSDLTTAKREWAAAGNFSPVPAADMDFCVYVAHKSTKMPIEFFHEMPAKEFSKLTQVVSNFLLV